MIYYPLSTLLLAGIRDVLLISTPQDIGGFERLLGDGSQVGISIRYAVQPKPGGLAEAFLIGREFVGNDDVSLFLGDNIFYGQSFQAMLGCATLRGSGATVLAYSEKIPSAVAWSFSTPRAGPCRWRRNHRSRARTSPSPACFLRQPSSGHRSRTQAVAARRTENHRCQPRVPETGTVARRNLRPRFRLARHRHTRIAEADSQFRRNHRVAPGTYNYLH